VLFCWGCSSLIPDGAVNHPVGELQVRMCHSCHLNGRLEERLQEIDMEIDRASAELKEVEFKDADVVMPKVLDRLKQSLILKGLNEEVSSDIVATVKRLYFAH
jgi:hypothetical protein